MLLVYYGNDMVAARRAALTVIDVMTAENNVRLHKIESERYTAGMITDMLGATSLFGGIEIYLLDTPSDDTQFYDEVTTVLSEMSSSSNTFIVIESTLLAAERKKFEKFTSTLEEFKKGAAIQFNAFAMADALSAHDKKSLWVLLQAAIRNGLSAEEIIGTLWWQLKSLRLTAVTNSASEAGMKDFPYNKSKRALRNFKTGELETLSANLLQVYHDGHGGVRDTMEGLEEWVLRG